MNTVAPVPVCRDCWEEFDIDSSPDLDRCERCAEEQAWQDSTAQLITGRPRFGKGAVLVAPFDLIVSAPAGREQKEG